MTTLEEPKHSEGQQDQSKPGDLETKKTIVEETQVHSKSGDMELEKTIIRTAERRLTTTVLVGLIGALLVTICHHLFLFIIDGRPAQAQLWIKNASNAFSQVVVLFMGLIAASSLTQSIWWALSREYTQISVIDNLFSLPSPSSAFSVSTQRKRRFILPLAISLVIQALALVSTFAPNSLTTGISHGTNITSSTPVTNYFAQIPNLGASSYLSGETWMDRAMSTPLEFYWDPPSNCGVNCTIQRTYQAPALSCRKLKDDELRLSAYNGTGTEWVYYKTGYSPYSSEWGNPYAAFWVNYAPNQASFRDNQSTLVINPTAPVGGIQCNFQDGDYQATFELGDGVKSVVASKTSSNNGTAEGCTWTDSQSPSSKCGNYSMNANTIDAAFLNAFNWTGSCTNSGHWSCSPLPQIGSMAKYIHDTYNDPNNTFTITTSDLASILEELYSNVTLVAMLSMGDTEPGWILASDGHIVWNYSPEMFWIIYGIALGLILAVALGNLSLVANHNVGMNTEFASILTSTRNKSLDQVYAADGDTIMETKLRFSADRLRFDIQETSPVYQKLLENQNETSTNRPITIESKNADTSDNTMAERANRIHRDKVALTIMITAYLVAVISAVNHHVFLWKINNTLVPDHYQSWVRNASNGFAEAVVFCLKLVAANSLTQVVWRVIEATPTSVAVINRLFSLPEVDAYFRFLALGRRPDWVPAGLIVLTTYMLLLVKIIAPNALTVATRQETTIQIKIPQWNYTYSSLDGYGSLETSDILPSLVWTKPRGCGAICEFEFEYEAPGLVCTDYHSDLNPTSGGNGDGWNFIGTNYTSFGGGTMEQENSGEFVWGLTMTEPIWIQYIPSVIQMATNSTPIIKSTGTPVGSLCQYQGATYQAKFNISNDLIDISTRPLSYNDAFRSRCPWNATDSPQSECNNEGRSSQYMAQYFTANIFQNINITYGSGALSNHPSLMSLGIVDFRGNLSGDDTFSLELKTSNISEYLVGLFSNYTLNILAQAPDHQTINATTSGSIVWHYEARTLWYTYGPALGVLLIVLLYGLYCVYENEMPLDKKFSTLMAATRNDKLNELVEKTKSYDALKEVELRYKSNGRFVVRVGLEESKPEK